MSHIRKLDRGGRFVSSKNSRKNIFLRSERIQHALFDGAFGNEINNLHRRQLTVTMGARDALFKHSGIPREIEIDDEAGGLQVETHAACVSGEEDAAVGVVEKFLDEVAALGGGDIAREFDVAETDAFEDGFSERQHGCPLRKDDSLACPVSVI